MVAGLQVAPSLILGGMDADMPPPRRIFDRTV
jgi:hypothetical protein